MKIKEILEYLLLKIQSPKVIQGIFTSKKYFFDYSYMPSQEFFTGIWKSKELDGKEFMSIVLGN